MIKENLKSDKDIKVFAAELKSCFSKEEIEKIARETGFVKRKGKIEAWEFICLCCFMDAEVANNTLVTLCTKLSAKMGYSRHTCKNRPHYGINIHYVAFYSLIIYLA